ncbi:lytic transglycosylase domain-containing protein [Gluconobacter frateurii]|uniref:Murein transglycosylase n=1 Tax=Gluconobacter frateurii NRIC 0228 TaxID=1307946 RepID=A0ABQ0QE64_9PROT|nr:lytic transglycosylase domain-containing protein [Gluconobacter frateurii]GBR15785.1 murein transglycosylase [Gluconobacter frateurii NRIC 0228]GLP90401.1 lytic transglycosylase [Gluconobacter frateurii]
MLCCRAKRPVLLAAALCLGAAAPPPNTTPPVRDRLVQWLQLVTPGAGNLPAETYESFLVQAPVWPQRAKIMWRYQTALSHTSDPATLDQLCPTVPLTMVSAFLACSDHLPDGATLARNLWVSGAGNAQEEATLLGLYGAAFTPSDQWRRYERLESSGQIAAASRQIDRLPVDRQALAEARIAERAASPDADTAFNALSSAERSDPTLIRYRLKALRRGNRLDEALALWTSAGYALQATAPSHDWSSERGSLARAFLLAGRTQDAYALAQDMTLPLTEIDRQEAQNLSGFIALRLLDQPRQAEQFFLPLQQATSLAMQARGWYWVGRCRQTAGDSEGAQAAFQQATRFPTTFHGQLAQASLTGEKSFLVAGASSPDFDHALQQELQALPSLSAGALQRQDLVEAATELAQSGDLEHAKDFLLLLQIANPSPEGQKAVADLGRRLNVPAAEVFAAHALSRKGVALYPQGFPDPWPEASTVPEGLLPAVIRQESGFDPAAISSAHAIGLLQILPAAAKDVIRRAHMGSLNVSAAALLDPHTNLIVGNAYVSQLLTRFENTIPYALAAYNAGPHRVDLWLQANPPASPMTEDGLLDWIERLPYRETRMYIENIEANMMVYRVSATNVRN